MKKSTIKHKIYATIAGISMCAPAILTPIANADTLTISNQHIITGNTHLKVNNSNQDALDAVASSASSSSTSSASSQQTNNDQHKNDNHPNVSSSSASSASSSSASSSVTSHSTTTTTTVTTITKTTTASSTKSSNNSGNSSDIKLNNNQPSLTINANSPQAQKIVDYAKQIAAKHVPYVWGGTTMSGFDCSGFTQYVYREAGIGLPRTAAQQAGAVKRISVSDAKPGDLLFWGSRGNEYHVAIYIGGNEFIAAPEPGQTVSVQHISGYFAPSSAGTVR